MAGLLDESDPYSGGYSLLEDPWAAAARRQREAVMPMRGRNEGETTAVLEALGRIPMEMVGAAAGLVDASRDAAAEMTGQARTLSTDYDPRRFAAQLAAENAMNIVGTPALTGGVPAGALGAAAGPAGTIRKAAAGDKKTGAGILAVNQSEDIGPASGRGILDDMKKGTGSRSGQSPIGAQPTRELAPTEVLGEVGKDTLPVGKKTATFSPDDARAQIEVVSKLMEPYGYKLENVKGSGLSEAQYLTFRTAEPPGLSKRGVAEVFEKLRAAGIGIGNNPTGGNFTVRIAVHKSGAGGYPSPNYEWSLHSTPEKNSVRLKLIHDTVRDTLKRYPAGGLHNK